MKLGWTPIDDHYEKTREYEVDCSEASPLLCDTPTAAPRGEIVATRDRNGIPLEYVDTVEDAVIVRMQRLELEILDPSATPAGSNPAGVAGTARDSP